jgi:hypothetical protein
VLWFLSERGESPYNLAGNKTEVLHGGRPRFGMSSNLMGHLQPSSHAPNSQSRRRSPAARYVTELWSSPPILLLGIGSEGVYSVLKRVEEGSLGRRREAWKVKRKVRRKVKDGAYGSEELQRSGRRARCGIVALEATRCFAVETGRRRWYQRLAEERAAAQFVSFERP